MVSATCFKFGVTISGLLCPALQQTHCCMLSEQSGSSTSVMLISSRVFLGNSVGAHAQLPDAAVTSQALPTKALVCKQRMQQHAAAIAVWGSKWCAHTARFSAAVCAALLCLSDRSQVASYHTEQCCLPLQNRHASRDADLDPLPCTACKVAMLLQCQQSSCGS